MSSPGRILRDVAARVRARRLQVKLTQVGLASRAGMTTASLKRFERTGLIAFDALVRLAFALGAEKEFESLFPPSPYMSLDEVVGAEKPRRRGVLK
jgi:transcriptional regulator with XRE-family HTH domain